MANNGLETIRWGDEGTWKCAVGLCGVDHTGGTSIRQGSDEFCLDCIGFYFERASDLKTGAYPPRIGPIRLDIDYFAPMLPEDIVTAFRRADNLFKTAPSYERVVCQRPSAAVDASPGRLCNGLIGKRLDDNVEDKNVLCPKCSRTVCGVCGVGVDEANNKHSCNVLTTHEALPQSEDRGKGFQVCPKCREIMNLGSGCNHITCPRCDGSFCFLCGVEAAGTSNHWRKDGGGCPRYNALKPAEGAPAPRFDEDLNLGSDDDEDDDEDESDDDEDDNEWEEYIYLSTRLVDFGLQEPFRLGPSQWRAFVINFFTSFPTVIPREETTTLVNKLARQAGDSAKQLTLALQTGTLNSGQESRNAKISRHLYIAHHAVKFRQGWNLVQWAANHIFNHEWPSFDSFEDLRKLTLWLGIDWERTYGQSSPEALPVDLTTIRSFLRHLADIYPRQNFDAQNDPPDVLNRGVTSVLVRALLRIVVELRKSSRTMPPWTTMLNRMNIKLDYRFLETIYRDHVCNNIGLQNYRDSGRDQRMLCHLVDILVKDTLLLGDDSIGRVYSMQQAHIMSGCVYFTEIVKTIGHLVPDSNITGDGDVVYQIALGRLRRVASMLLEHANGGTDWSPEKIAQLRTAHRDLRAACVHLVEGEDGHNLLLAVANHVCVVCDLVLDTEFGEDEEGDEDEDEQADREAEGPADEQTVEA